VPIASNAYFSTTAGANVVKVGTQPLLATDGSGNAILNTPPGGYIFFEFNGSQESFWTTAVMNLAQAQWQFAETVSEAQIIHQSTSSASGGNMVITPQQGATSGGSLYAALQGTGAEYFIVTTAGANTVACSGGGSTGTGAIWLGTGAFSSSNPALYGDGAIQVILNAPTGGSASIQVGRSYAVEVTLPGGAGTVASLYLGGVSATTGHAALEGDASITVLNAPPGAPLVLSVDAITIAELTSSTVQFAQPVMGLASTNPFQFGVYTAAFINITTNPTITVAQAAQGPIFQLSGVLTHDTTYTLKIPNVIGSFYLFDCTILSGYEDDSTVVLNIETATGSFTPASLTLSNIIGSTPGGKLLITVCVPQSGVVSAG
jgi:hypothetical protein